jgi:UDP-3-O-[3-hydroxymyristoyl] glucosamine N-acyltransferase
VVEEGAALGDRVRVGAHCVVGRNSRLGADTLLHPHVVLYPRTEVGRRVILHAGARLGVDGFGYAFRDGAYHKIPQVGRCVIEDDVEVGANTCLDRGSIGETRVGRGTKLDNLIQVGHNVRLGPVCVAAAQVGFAGSTRVGAGVVFGGQSGVVGHVSIGDGARVGAKSVVTGNVSAGETVAGFPARDLKRFMKASAVFLKLPDLLRRVRKLEAARPAESGGGEG